MSDYDFTTPSKYVADYYTAPQEWLVEAARLADGDLAGDLADAFRAECASSVGQANGTVSAKEGDAARRDLQEAAIRAGIDVTDCLACGGSGTVYTQSASICRACDGDGRA